MYRVLAAALASFFLLAGIGFILPRADAAKGVESSLLTATTTSAIDCVAAARFEAFPVPKTGETTASLNFGKTTISNELRAAVVTQVASGPNFASHYAIASANGSYALADTVRGGVTVLPYSAKYGLSYRADSKLFVVDPLEQMPDVTLRTADATTSYYLLEEGKLVELCAATAPSLDSLVHNLTNAYLEGYKQFKVESRQRISAYTIGGVQVTSATPGKITYTATFAVTPIVPNSAWFDGAGEKVSNTVRNITLYFTASGTGEQYAIVGATAKQ